MKKIFSIVCIILMSIFVAFQAYKVTFIRDYIASILPQNIKHNIKNSLFIVQSLKEQLQTKNEELAASRTELEEAKQKAKSNDLQTYFIDFSNQVTKSWPYFSTLLSQTQLDLHIQSTTQTLKATQDNETYRIKKFNLPFLPTALSFGYKPLFFLDSTDTKIYMVTGDGVIFTTSKSSIEQKNLVLTSLPNNLRHIIPNKALYEPSWFSIKDIKILHQRLYISYNKKVGENYTLGIMSADLTQDVLEFSEFFTIDDTVSPTQGLFNAHQLGGRIEKLDEQHLIVSTGDMSKWEKAQDGATLLGKIFKINIHNKSVKILSKGHRNPQGLFFDKENNAVFSTEHGPNGGDEFNVNPLSQKGEKNFGWPMASYGLHYDGRFHEEAPLHKSHKEHGYIEPIKNFSPSVGISQVIKLPKGFKPNLHNDFFVATMGLNHSLPIQSIHHFSLKDDLSTIKRHTIIKVNERIRDIVVLDERHIMLALEGNNTPALAILQAQ